MGNENQKNKQKTHWTTVDLAKKAGVSSARIRQLLLAGELHGDKAGPVWIIHHSEAERFLSNRGVEI
jgi:phage pi2 protein 07